MNGKKPSITEGRIAELNTIGFEWKINPLTIQIGTWQDKFKLLCDFQQKHGHCRVPQSLVVKSCELGVWVSDIQKHYKNFMSGKTSSLISEEQIAELNVIGFEWQLKNLEAALNGD